MEFLKRETKIIGNLQSIIDRLPYTSARNIAKLTGRIISTSFVLGNVVRLKTRQLYGIINQGGSPDSVLTHR